MRVAIIGSGPAGLLAAHAVAGLGNEPVIYTNRPDEPSPNAAATFLHRSIPDLTSPDPDGFVTMEKRGSAEGYAEKVYGSPTAPTSWAKFPTGRTPAWAVPPAYAELWRRYSPSFVEREIQWGHALALSVEFGLVINTAPAPAICGKRKGCSFPSRPLWVGSAVTRESLGPNTMVYNGESGSAWMRASDVFGVRSVEYPRPWRGLDLAEGIKVLPTTCECHPKIVRAGRWGTWRPGVLLHHAYERALEAIHAV